MVLEYMSVRVKHFQLTLSSKGHFRSDTKTMGISHFACPSIHITLSYPTGIYTLLLSAVQSILNLLNDTPKIRIDRPKKPRREHNLLYPPL